MRRWLIMSAALALLLAACGGTTSVEGTGPSEADAGSEATAGSEEGSDDTAAEASGQAETFSEIFGYDEDPEAAEARYREDERRIQELVRTCMAEQGFEYIPVEQPAESFDFGPQDQREFVEKQGFGISTWYGNEEVFEGPSEGQEFVDPNQAITDGMSESEQDAYFGALYGTPEEHAELEETVIDEETGEEYTTFSGHGPGCYGAAQAEVYGSFEQNDEVFAQLEPIYEELEQRMAADPRIVEANGTWSACMADRGYDYESPQDFYETAIEDFQRRFEEIVGPNGGFQDPFEGWSDAEVDAFFEERSDEEIEAFFAEQEKKSRESVDQEALEALQAEEIELAVAEYECSEPLQELYREVSESIERELVAENRDLFDEVREATQN